MRRQAIFLDWWCQPASTSSLCFPSSASDVVRLSLVDLVHHTRSLVMSAQPIKTPSSASTPSAVPGTTEKGAMLYYEKLRKELREMLQRKRVLDKNLVRPSRARLLKVLLAG